MAKKREHGTFIHGIAASEHLDSSGERISIDGVDISSLTKDGVFNFEHESKQASSIVGKILEAKKIFKRSDCDNDNQRYFWDKLKMPYIYVAGELFDAVGHQAAQDVAAMLKYDKQTQDVDTKPLINFSIEGSRLDHEGSNITKCIARKVSITITPCNKVCEAEELDKNSLKTETKKNLIDSILARSEDSMCEIMKALPKKYHSSLYSGKPKASSKATYKPMSTASAMSTTGEGLSEKAPGKEVKPKRIIKPGDNPDKLKVGDRIQHKSPRAKTGKEIYEDPDTWKSDSDIEKSKTKKRQEFTERKKKINRKKTVRKKPVRSNPTSQTQDPEAKRKAQQKYSESVRGVLHKNQAVEKGDVHGLATGTKVFDSQGKRQKVPETGGHYTTQAESDESVKDYQARVREAQAKRKKKKLSKYDSNVRKALTASCGMGTPSTKEGGAALSKEDMHKICKSISDENWSTFTKKEELVSFLEGKLPNLQKNEIMALAKTVAYYHVKKQELALQDLAKAKVDKIKYPKGSKGAATKRRAARAERKEGYTPHTKEKWTKPEKPGGEQKRVAKIPKTKTKEERKKKLDEQRAKRPDKASVFDKPKYPKEHDLEHPDIAASEKNSSNWKK